MNNIAFQPTKYNTKNPDWTRKRFKKGDSLSALADHICTRTPAYSYGNHTNLEMIITIRNYSRLNQSYRACEILANMVASRLVMRDGKL